MEEQHIYLHALRSLPNMSDKVLRKLLGAFGFDARATWEGATLTENIVLGPVFKNIWNDRQSIIPDPFSHTYILEEQSIFLVTETDSLYPEALKEVPDHPYFLYVRGNLPKSTLPLLAVVGSRKFTSYGKQVCESLVRDAARSGIGIVSGLAFGIDKIAHEAALRKGAYTLAVLGSGIDDNSITPTSNQKVAQEILHSGGALVSEFAPGTTPHPGNFPLRNRIIAGLTSGTLVIEAAEKSGSLITARLALDYNRSVFAVPGSIFSLASQGTNSLLKAGAIPVTSVQDIITELLPEPTLFSKESSSRKESFPLPLLSADESALLTFLSHDSLSVDELIKKSSFPAARVATTLTLLEIKGLIKNIGNQQYIFLPK